MVNLLEVNFKEYGELELQINGQLVELFGSEEEMLKHFDGKSLEKPLFDFANEVLRRAKEIEI